MKNTLLLSAILSALLFTGCSEPTHEVVYTCLRADNALTIDGKLDEKSWEKAGKSSIAFPVVMQKGAKEINASYKMLWDDVNLYFSAEIKDSTPWAAGKKLDDPVWMGDCFEIFLNPDNREGEYYEIDFNSDGTAWDSFWLKHKSGGSRVANNWTAPSLVCKTSKNTDGWTIEGRIKFSEFVNSSHIPPLHGDMWHMTVNYLDAPGKKGRQSIYSWGDMTDIADSKQFGRIIFLDPVNTGIKEKQIKTAEKLLAEGVLASAEKLSDNLDNVEISSEKGKAFTATKSGSGWAVKKSMGRFTKTEVKEIDLTGFFKARPISGDDGVIVSFKAWKSGKLIAIGNLQEAGEKYIGKAFADGTWIETAAGSVKKTIHLHSTSFQAEAIDVNKGDNITIKISAGPAQNFLADFAQVGVFIIP
ncbi:MAG: carbohydrate-binding family 9-like protein [Planctomycetota bacterium]|jgi:hypothetical protein